MLKRLQERLGLCVQTSVIGRVSACYFDLLLRYGCRDGGVECGSKLFCELRSKPF